MAKRSKQTLQDFIEIKHGFAFSSKSYSDSGEWVLLTPGNFREEGGFRWLGEKQKYFIGEVPKAYVLAAGQMLIAMTEQAPGLLGSTFFVPTDRTYLHNQRLGLITIKDTSVLHSYYLHYFFSTLPIRTQIAKQSAGTKVKHTSPDKLLALSIEPPTIGEQIKIATVLETWGEAISKAEAISQEVGNLQTALYQKIFERQFDMHRQLLRASRLFESVSERSRPDLPLLAVMQDVGVVRRDELDRRVTMPDGDTSSYKVVRPGDFIISLRSFEGALNIPMCLAW